MSDFPEGWFRDEHGGGRSGTPVGHRAGKPSAWPEQPPVRSRRLTNPWRSPVLPKGEPGFNGHSGWNGGPGWRRPQWGRRIFAGFAVLVVLLLLGTVVTYFYLNGKLSRSDVLVDYSGRPAPGSGTNWLIAGSDSRQGLTRQQELQFSTGRVDSTGFGRSDTIMILHIPAGGGRPLLISLPRDSYVPIPGHGTNKLNAAFSYGGPKLLAETVQGATGLYINHFMDIGFGGFVNVVNAVGGVRMCLPTALHDTKSGLNLPAGCQTLSGGQALSYVRDRHSFGTSDLQREQDQRIFLSALLKKMTSAGVILNPFSSIPAASGVAGNVTVDKATQLYQLMSVARALRNPLTTTVPIANPSYPTSVGSAVKWDHTKALQLFTDLQNGQTVPANLISGSKAGTA